jgi:hypothetical protein
LLSTKLVPISPLSQYKIGGEQDGRGGGKEREQKKRRRGKCARLNFSENPGLKLVPDKP